VLLVILLPGGLHQAWAGAVGWWRARRAAPAERPGDAAAGSARSGIDAAGESALFSRAGRSPAGTTAAEVRGLTKRFGGVVAVDAVDLDVRTGEILALIGPNGAGKTTFFNMVSGVLAPTSGTVTLNGARIDGRKPHVFARARATRTFQNLQIFASASVLGNVMVGRHLRSRSGMLRGALLAPSRREERQIAQAAYDTLQLVGLGDDAFRAAADLPFGRQRLVEVARALALEPDLLLLDEPYAGLSGDERRELARLLRRLRAGGMAIVLVEHDMEVVLALADRVAVLDDGRLIALGTPAQIRADPVVVAAYLGVDEHDTEAEDVVRQLSGESGGGRS
jgi:branched-chain amino acid transport system permease protein